METIEELKRRIGTAEDLQSVVKTMKALAAVNIRHYEKAVEALTAYAQTIEMGLQIVLKRRPGSGVTIGPSPKQRLAGIVFGSDQGMCGPLNEQIVSHVREALQALGVRSEDRAILAVGVRVAARLEDAGLLVEEALAVPGSPAGFTILVQDILLKIDEWRFRRQFDSVALFYSQFLSGAAFHPHTEQLLPLDQYWLQRLEHKHWPSRMLPSFTMDRERLFSTLIRQYLFVSLYRACAESLASENASRLTSMQNAEHNISERLEELQALFRQERQMSITGELLDIVAGFEALTTEKERNSL